MFAFYWRTLTILTRTCLCARFIHIALYACSIALCVERYLIYLLNYFLEGAYNLITLSVPVEFHSEVLYTLIMQGTVILCCFKH